MSFINPSESTNNKVKWWGPELERLRKKVGGSLKKPDNTFTGTPEETERVLVQTHFPGCHIMRSVHWSEEETVTTEEHWQQALEHAYSQGKSTESALHAVVSRIEEAIENKSMCLGTFIDIEGAFDKTNFSSITSALTRHRVNPVMVEWIGNMLSKRIIRLNSSETQHALVARGCPQGGVLSPLLWNMVVNDLITRLNQHHYYTIGLFNTELQFSSEVKYLGVILDSKLNWSNHLNNKIDKATVAFWQCRRMVGKQWGLSPKVTLWLYQSVIRPIISYGAVVWWPRTKLITVEAKLQRFQRLACMATPGCMRTTPTAALEALLGLPPLHLFIQQEAGATAVRLKKLNLWKSVSVPHAKLLDELVHREPLFEAVTDRIPKQYVFDKKYKIQLHEDPGEGLNLKELRIFTDGSKTSTGTGSGTHSEDLNINISKPLGAHNTVFQAECMGIIMATAAIDSRKVQDFPIRILSDSKSVLQALQSDTMTSGLIYECHRALTLVSETNTITLQWIKGHSGSRGNDAADRLARGGSDMKVFGPEPILPLPFGWLRGKLRHNTKVMHQQYWTNLDTCRQTREALPTINSGLSRKLRGLRRDQLRLLVGALTGHALLNKHLHNLGVTDSPLCRACMEAEETATHILLECSGVANYRALHLGSPGSLQEVAGNIAADYHLEIIELKCDETLNESSTLTGLESRGQISTCSGEQNHGSEPRLFQFDKR
ncbi:uncharacterized protein [Choristoneura fumiferana]|uniref:uncharacterized protein n=1 Tax=Choristoneura fumiferana TaxID=7141 RepID=UPI003D153881